MTSNRLGYRLECPPCRTSNRPGYRLECPSCRTSNRRAIDWNALHVGQATGQAIDWNALHVGLQTGRAIDWNAPTASGNWKSGNGPQLAHRRRYPEALSAFDRGCKRRLSGKKFSHVFLSMRTSALVKSPHGRFGKEKTGVSGPARTRYTDAKSVLSGRLEKWSGQSRTSRTGGAD